MIEDADLLHRYVKEKSEEAFAELVRRRVDLVYSVALRQVGGDSHLAEDVTQKVFTALSHKAAGLLGRPVLSGWLYRASQFVAADVVRAERRRRDREQATGIMQELSTPNEPEPDWDRLRPLLDRAMGELSDPDRDAIALRFFENRALAEIGRALQVTEDAARKRIDRALDKLAAILSRHGVTSTSAAIAAALAQQTAIAAPAGLAVAVASAITAGATATSFTAALLSLMHSGKITLAAGIVAASALGAAIYENHVVQQRDAELTAVAGQQRNAQAKLAETQQRLQVAEERARAAEQDASRLLAAIQNQSASRAASASSAPEPLTHDYVQERFRRAQELARSGDPAEALREFLWCLDVGMRQVREFSGVRASFLPSSIADLGRNYPPALAALRERRDKAEQRLMASERDFDATQTFASLNRYLKETDRTIARLDQIPAGDSRRPTLAMVAFDDLLEQRRYSVALEGTTFAQMQTRFEMGKGQEPPPNLPNQDRLRAAQRDYVVSTTAKHVEVLAGSQHLKEAQSLAERLLSYDSSDQTRALLQKHAERAGQPDLLAPPKG